MLKILEFTEAYPSTVRPYTALFVKSHIDHLSHHADLQLIVFHRLIPPKNIWFKLSPLKLWIRSVKDLLRKAKKPNNQKIIYFHYMSLPRPWFEFLNIYLITWLYYYRMLKIVKAVNPDILICHWVFPVGMVVQKIGRCLGKPVIIDIHEDPESIKLNFPFALPVWKSILNDASYCIIHSEKNKEKIIANNINKNKLEKIYLGVDSVFSRILKSNPKEFTIITTAHLSDPRKNIDILIQAYALIIDKLPNSQLIIIGDGKLKTYLMGLVQVLGINCNVKFIGALPQKEIADYLSRAHLFVLPSDRESFGLAFIEAITVGLPVIGSHSVGALNELEKINFPVITIDKITDQELASSILHVFIHYNKYKKDIESYKDKIQGLFSWKYHAEEYYRICSGLAIFDEK